MRQVEERVGKPLPIYLNEAYNARGLSCREIARELAGLGTGVNHATVARWMNQLGVTRGQIGG